MSLKVPNGYQRLRFQGWLENGELVSNDPLIEVNMDSDKTLLPLYTAKGFESLNKLQELSAGSLTGKASTTRIYAGVIDNLGTAGRQFSKKEIIDIKAEFHVSAQEQGEITDIYIVALYEGLWFMKDSNNNWVSWNVNVNSLVANSAQSLESIHPVNIVEGLSGLPGSFSIFVGHGGADGDIYYNTQPLNFTVK